MPLRLPFCGMQLRDRNRRAKGGNKIKQIADNDSSNNYAARIPLVGLPFPSTGDRGEYFIFKASASIIVTHSNPSFSSSFPLKLIGNNLTSVSQAD